MLIVETIRKVRLAHHRDHKSIREIARDFNLSRNTVRKIIRSGATEFTYERKVQPRPRLEPFKERLATYLEQDSRKAVKEQRTALLLFEQLQREGFAGGYDSVRRFVQKWRTADGAREIKAFIPLSFAPGEAFQFDWSYEPVELGGVNVRVKVAQFRLSHSRMPFCVAYVRETLEMVLDAHVRAFEFFGGACRKGIYDNLKTVVSKVLMGKERVFNRRFVSLASHYLFEPVACTPAAGWEKGQIEKQVGFVRQRFFNQRRKFTGLEELNQWLADQCRTLAAGHKHPEFPDRTVAEVFADEQEHLVRVKVPFDSYRETTARVSFTSLVNFDRNRYSVHASAVGKTIAVRAYADRLILVADGQTVGVHVRQFGRDKTLFDPWHYLEVLKRKPGALRNGAPFKDWELPVPLKEVRAALLNRPDGDKQFVGILCAALTHGLEAVVDACAEAVAANTISRDVILNILSRTGEEAVPEQCAAPSHLPPLRMPPVADCHRYDQLLAGGAHAA
ncbi:transposase [Geobacter sulfurreducens]|nr:transposase [Geobacter sulfurreducens]AJY68891.1 transposase [Geobacter sulfurreducens]AJY70370.1 transposase [Geobacter sulfurreducens]AJY70694.1 transposase [Geobacter sulfurreducens]AJY71435.1 transposase [Geobacter sulfurreducens]